MSYNATFTLRKLPPAEAQWTRESTGDVLTPTALLRAAKQGEAARIRALIEAGAKVDAPDPDGWTPLFWAIKNRHVKAAAELIVSGARLDIEARNGLTPLALAVKSGSPLIIDLITRAGGK